MLARSGAQAAIVGPLVLVAVLAVGGLQLVDGRITAGELFAAGQYAVLGAGLGSLTGVIGEIARAKAGIQRAAEVFAIDGAARLAAAAGRTGHAHLRRRHVSWPTRTSC